MIHAQLFVFFFWGIPQLQSDWNLSCDHAIDYASECENNNNNKYARNSARNMPNIVKETLNTHKSSSSKSISKVLKGSDLKLTFSHYLSFTRSILWFFNNVATKH